jgi:DNA-binding CsgD family transcriptional regulator
VPESNELDPADPSLVARLAGPVVDALGELPAPMWVADRRGRLVWINSAATTLFGDRRGAHFSRLIGPERVNDARELFARKVLGAKDATVQPTILLTVGGRLEAELTSVPLRIDSGVIGVLSMVRCNHAERAGDEVRRASPKLTPRQYEVLSLLAHGLTTAQIAGKLGIAQETARNHVRLVLQQLDVHTRLAAVVVAFRNGWL